MDRLGDLVELSAAPAALACHMDHTAAAAEAIVAEVDPNVIAAGQPRTQSSASEGSTRCCVVVVFRASPIFFIRHQQSISRASVGQALVRSPALLEEAIC